MADHQYEVECDCGASWYVTMPFAEDDDAMATCTACGADTFRLVDLGPVHSVGFDVDG